MERLDQRGAVARRNPGALHAARSGRARVTGERDHETGGEPRREEDRHRGERNTAPRVRYRRVAAVRSSALGNSSSGRQLITAFTVSTAFDAAIIQNRVSGQVAATPNASA